MNAVIIGCGVIASRWLRTLSADPRIRVVVVVDPDLARARELASRYGVPRAAATLTEAATVGPVQVAVNLTPPAAHTAVTRHALQTGLHVLTEIQNRGVKDIFICCVDGLKGFPEAIQAVYPRT